MFFYSIYISLSPLISTGANYVGKGVLATKQPLPVFFVFMVPLFPFSFLGDI